MGKRVVITGIGPVTSVGIGKKEFAANLLKRHCPVRPVPDDFLKHHAFRSRFYVPLPEVSFSGVGFKLRHEHLLQPEDRMVVFGAKLAFEDAGIPISDAGVTSNVSEFENASVIIGTGFSSLQSVLDSFLCHCFTKDVLNAAFPSERLSFDRMAIPKTMPNSSAAWVSICFGLKGASNTINASCASGTYAIGEAFRRIRDGYDQVVLTGGVECLRDRFGLVMRGFDALGVLTQASDGVPRPFGKQRSGFLFAEGGACLLVLEELQHALQRSAPIYAEITDFRANSDRFNIMQVDPQGTQLQQLLRELSAGRRIDYLNAHGTGTVANDDLEARSIQAVYGNRETQPSIESTKGILGHTLGASSAIEAAVTALSVKYGVIHGNLTEAPIDNLNLPLSRTEVQIENAISVSCGFGGHNGGLLFQRYEPKE